MKTLRIITLAVGLLAVAAFGQTQAPVFSNLVLTPSQESLRRTPVVAGDYNRVISMYYMENRGNSPGMISFLRFKIEGLTNAFVEVDGNGQWLDIRSNFDKFGNKLYDYVDYSLQQPAINIAASKSIKIVIRGSIDQGASFASAVSYGIGGSWNFSNFSDIPLPTRHPVVDEVAQEGLGNISIRTTMSPDYYTSVGFVVVGDEWHSYPVLVRAIGPGLKRFGVTGTMTDPTVRIFDSSGNQIDSNDDWSEPNRGLEWVFAQAGAFGLDKASLDSALLVNLQPGTYTIQVKGYGTGQGQGLVEAYQLKPPPPNSGKG